MSQAQSGDDPKRRKAVRRHRRERQIVVFGVILIALAALAFAASAVYSGDVDGPFAREFTSPEPELGDIDVVCPPAGAMPVDPAMVVVRTNNATEVNGLAGTAQSLLRGRGFVTVGAANWPYDFDGFARIYFGEQGVAQAYTLARQFEDAELILDTRPDITLDLVVGTAFGESPQLREPLAPELDPDLQLTADGECRPASLVTARLAPRNLPDNPLAEASPTPSPEADEG